MSKWVLQRGLGKGGCKEQIKNYAKLTPDAYPKEDMNSMKKKITNKKNAMIKLHAPNECFDIPLYIDF